MTSAANKLLSAVSGLQVIRTKKLERYKALASQSKSLRRFRPMPNIPTVYERIEQIGALLDIKSVVNVEKVRIGASADGGYVCLNDLHKTVAALSIGIGGDVSWDSHIADRNISVYQYDHTVEAPPLPHENFVFHRSRLSTEAGNGTETLATILAKYKLTLPATVIAKIDIEGDEWDVLNNASIETLSMFSQLICEFHSFEQMVDDEFFQRAVQVFLKLGEVFEPIHVHGNNYSPLLIVGNKLFPDVLEVTFANRSIYAFDKNKEIFPGPLDAPNNPRVEDYHLGFFKY